MKPEIALALIMKRWRDWQEVARYQLPAQQEAERQNLLELFVLYQKMKKKKSQATQVQFAIEQPISQVEAREEKIRKGNDALVVYSQPVDYEKYFEYIRMDVETYNELFKLLEPKIKKQFLIKYPIPAHTRLQICLRYLASGDSMTSISSAFKVANNTVSKIVTDTCQAIWDVLSNLVFPTPSVDLWKERAHSFETQWDFTHCIGAIDSRQLVLQTPVNTESNYCKTNETIVLCAIIDANSCFSLINIDVEEVLEDGINFAASETGCHLQDNTYDIPAPSKINETGPELPYVLAGNENFPLTVNLLRPYAATSDLDLPKQVFNYRIGRARKCSDCAFRILTNQWRIFHKKFSNSASNTIKITKAAICLHNFLMNKENSRPFQDRRYSLLSESDREYNILGCTNVSISSEIPSENAETVRNMFKDLFCEDGAILLEWE
ncbi:protein ALP1-like [Nasonia vitripennis]|uniref:DDE Tnp4 domain-containing protein n=1 Tax=Nasonia vitripennis TaxID=7425 RepID=A0A7M7GIB1_NASVI|nr:protein ALP1-like [Nasonia vitripennis]XP_008208281.1 protein ALP1-like [Nasonia vitripennis]XP_031789547.1 protein ALP1-like [Nasonia vitripennis]